MNLSEAIDREAYEEDLLEEINYILKKHNLASEPLALELAILVVKHEQAQIKRDYQGAMDIIKGVSQ